MDGAQLQMLQMILDALAVGVILSGRHGHVLHINAAAARIIGTGTALSLIRRKLCAADPAAARLLARAIAEVGGRDSRASASGVTLALADRGGRGLLATVLPIGRGGDLSDPNTASVAVLIQDLAAAPLCPGDAFARLYGLTPRELRVAQALLAGSTLREAAAALNVSLQTVKTHLQRIFQKTATSRQADVIALMWRASGTFADGAAARLAG